MSSDFIELNGDQRRELVNTQQRFAAWREAAQRLRDYRGSMVWSTSRGRDYLLRSAYDRQGRRRQTSLGPRGPNTERIKADYEMGRSQAEQRELALRPVMRRQAAVNQALGLGRVPMLGARILRLIDRAGLMGAGLRVLGTHALYAYEALAGCQIDPAYTTTEDIDLLFDARCSMSFVASEDIAEASLLKLLQRADRSFRRSRQDFRAVNDQGYLVDLIKPLRHPPWTQEAATIGGDPEDLSAVEIEGLDWHESATAVEAVAIDERGAPLRIVTSDPRVFAAHKLWLSERADREPLKRRRDRAQAKLTARLVASHLPQYPYVADELRMLPREVFEAAAPLFAAPPGLADVDL